MSWKDIQAFSSRTEAADSLAARARDVDRWAESEGYEVLDDGSIRDVWRATGRDIELTGPESVRRYKLVFDLRAAIDEVLSQARSAE
ncbi:hypothetical protein [Nocardia salmonicida]|uniref:hypothetical protein n=1 Tax=Nocardia salmonicida TaxID=53431 RepID=UPI002E2BFD37|nr:hypothetical protein [Nocardia salmonicida]